MVFIKLADLKYCMKASVATMFSFSFSWVKVSGGGAEDGNLQKICLHNLLLHFWLVNR